MKVMSNAGAFGLLGAMGGDSYQEVVSSSPGTGCSINVSSIMCFKMFLKGQKR